jgi:hypothetical protein
MKDRNTYGKVQFLFKFIFMNLKSPLFLLLHPLSYEHNTPFSSFSFYFYFLIFFAFFSHLPLQVLIFTSWGFHLNLKVFTFLHLLQFFFLINIFPLLIFLLTLYCVCLISKALCIVLDRTIKNITIHDKTEL